MADVASQKAIDCNCSICMKKGALLMFTSDDKFHLQSGADALTDYQFNKKVIHHTFCKTCGVQSFSRGRTPDGKKMVAINVRCLDNVDLSKVAVMPHDGRSQ